jgi:hypothetical protein
LALTRVTINTYEREFSKYVNQKQEVRAKRIICLPLLPLSTLHPPPSSFNL